MRFISIFTVSLGFVFYVQAYAGHDGRYGEQELLGIFDSGVVKFGIDVEDPLPIVYAEVVLNPATPILLSDISILCRGKSLCILDTYAEQYRGTPGAVKGLKNAFDNYGRPLGALEAEKAEKSLANLNSTYFGKQLCNKLTGGPCSLKSLDINGISLKTTPIVEKDLTTEIKCLDGKVLILLNSQPDFSNQNSYFWAEVLGHELSHAEDCKLLKGDLAILRLQSETKAYLTSLAVYNELKARYPDFINNTVLNFLVEVWNWKENNGPYPKDFKWKNGTIQSAKEFIERVINPSRDGIEAIRRITAEHYYPELSSSPVPVVLNVQYYEFLRNTGILAIEYNKWRINNPGLANHGVANPGNQPFPQPGTGNGSGENNSDGEGWHPGGGGNPGGGGIQPGVPNPHFPPNTWPTGGQ